MAGLNLEVFTKDSELALANVTIAAKIAKKAIDDLKASLSELSAMGESFSVDVVEAKDSI